MLTMIKDLIKHRELLLALTEKNIKIQYKQTIMGYLWALFMPMIVVLSGVVVKLAISIVSKQPLEISSIATVAVKALPWAYFVGAMKMAVPSLVSNRDLVEKIYFPRIVFPLSYIFSQAVDFMIATITLGIILTIAKIGVSMYILYLPLLYLLLILLTAALAIILSCGNLFFRDVKYIVDVLLTFGIFYTPVFYDASMFGKWKNLVMLNPVGAILENINNVVVLHKAPDMIWMWYAAAWAVFGFLGAMYVFSNAEPVFAENI